MSFFCRKNGFSLVEILAVIAIITVLGSIVIGVGKHVKEQGNIKLTQSTIDILVTATELYYQDNGDKMPFETIREVPLGSGNFVSLTVADPFSESDFDVYLYNRFIAPVPAYVPNIALDPQFGVLADWSSNAFYYFLNQSLNSRRIVAAINDSLVTTLDDIGMVNVTAFVNSPSVIDMPKFIDAWGNTLRYRYMAGETFCTITSPGKDKLYGTPDDITNSN